MKQFIENSITVLISKTVLVTFIGSFFFVRVIWRIVKKVVISGSEVLMSLGCLNTYNENVNKNLCIDVFL